MGCSIHSNRTTDAGHIHAWARLHSGHDKKREPASACLRPQTSVHTTVDGIVACCSDSPRRQVLNRGSKFEGCRSVRGHLAPKAAIWILVSTCNPFFFLEISLVSSDKLRQALTMAGSMRSTLCALLFRFAIFLVFACRERISASRAASHDALTAADPQTCFRPEPCGSARESATALGLAIRLTVGAAADLQQSTPTRHQDPYIHHIGYSTSCVSVPTLLHALRCFASQGHSSESSQCSAETPWTSADLFNYLGYPTSCVPVSTPLHALRCFASQRHSSESSQWSKWSSIDARFRQLGSGRSC